MSNDATGFELREHTADVALYVWGDSPESLFASATRGFYAALGQLEPAGSPDPEPFEIDLTAPDRADLLVDFLCELLYLFECRHARLIDVQFSELGDTRLRATGRLEPIDMHRSDFNAGIKAVTRHNLEIRTTPARLETTIILDI